MKSLTRKIAIVAAFVATAGVLGANADVLGANAEQATPSSQTVSNVLTAYGTPAETAPAESPQFERFEQQLSLMSAPSYTPSEHPDAKPAPKSAKLTPSVWDNPMNTEELGN
jgi:hypothetical protein